MEIVNKSITCLRADNRPGPGWFGRPVEKTSKEKKSGIRKAIYCSSCSQAITDRDQKIVVQGSHSHTFFNPAGVVFELGCFLAAPGCLNAGEATSEFSWFAGYVWSFALCRRCDSHLGWFFEGRDSSFFGLIFTQLSE